MLFRSDLGEYWGTLDAQGGFAWADRPTTEHPPVEGPFLPGTVTELPRQASGFIRTLAAQSPRHKELMMTIAEWLEEKGRKQGQQEGEQEATRSIAARMLARGLERQTVQELTGLSDEELAALAP